MAEKEKIKKFVKREEFLTYLKELITQIEGGYVVVGDKKVELPEEFEFELKYKYDEDKKKKEVEFEMEWKV